LSTANHFRLFGGSAGIRGIEIGEDSITISELSTIDSTFEIIGHSTVVQSGYKALGFTNATPMQHALAKFMELKLSENVLVQGGTGKFIDSWCIDNAN